MRWAKRWGPKIVLLKAPPDDIRNRAVPLWVDIESDQPVAYMPQPSSGSRWLETTELRKSLIARITLLAQGREPAELQLGDDVTQPAATQLLQRVLQRWCRGGVSRRHERHTATADCNFIAGFEGIPNWTDAQGERFHAFRDALTAATPDFQTKLGYPASAPGKANLTMSTNQLANRFAHLGCVSMTLEMPFKDHDPNPDAARAWSPDRCKALAVQCLTVMEGMV